MRARHVILLIVGVVVAVVGFGLTAGGATLLWANATLRDSDGYFTTREHDYRTDTYAITADADLGDEPRPDDWLTGVELARVRLRIERLDGRSVFIGIGPSDAVDAWLSGVRHAHLDDSEHDPRPIRAEGSREPGRPDRQAFWVATAEGPGRQTLTWPVEAGEWSLVVMNADGSPGVHVTGTIGARSRGLVPVATGMTVAGLVLLVSGGLALIAASRRREVAPPPATPSPTDVPAGTIPPPPAGTSADPPYPAVLTGRLDEPLSRWLWLVKWFLAIPHAVALAFLWLAVWVLTVVAGIAILFTGRYPRPIFDFNVGVARWTWRVGFYAFSVLGTDRYPPFSLRSDPDYPADLDVAYPERLSRGLVLVKWWLLAIPHYVIVAIFTGGGGFRIGDDSGDLRLYTGGLIGVLALVAVIVLLVRGSYPRSIFDMVMGMARWCLRVFAYAALMRDEYPPFRFDAGGTDPGGSLGLPAAPLPTGT